MNNPFDIDESTTVESGGLLFLAERFGDHFENSPKKVLQHIKTCLTATENEQKDAAKDAEQIANSILEEFHDMYPNIIPKTVNISPKMTSGIIRVNPPMRLGLRKTYAINLGEWFMKHPNLDPENDLREIICRGVAHAIIHKRCVDAGEEKCSLAKRSPEWKELMKQLSCNPDQECRPAKFVDDADLLPIREKKGRVPRVTGEEKPFDFEGDRYPKWKAVCPEGCVFGIKKWVNKTKVPKCVAHKLACNMFERKSRYSKEYKEEAAVPGFGKRKPRAVEIITETDENPDGALLVQDEKGNFRLAREVEICLPIDEPGGVIDELN